MPVPDTRTVEGRQVTTHEREVLRAALAWWKNRRPVRWTAPEHLLNPAVNVRDMREFRLAWAVAKWRAAK